MMVVPPLAWAAPAAAAPGPLTATAIQPSRRVTAEAAPTLKLASGAGYRLLAQYGVAPTKIGDRDLVTYEVPEFLYGGKAYRSIGVDANSYLVVGDAAGAAGALPGSGRIATRITASTVPGSPVAATDIKVVLPPTGWRQ